MLDEPFSKAQKAVLDRYGYPRRTMGRLPRGGWRGRLVLTGDGPPVRPPRLPGSACPRRCWPPDRPASTASRSMWIDLPAMGSPTPLPPSPTISGRRRCGRPTNVFGQALGLDRPVVAAEPLGSLGRAGSAHGPTRPRRRVRLHIGCPAVRAGQAVGSSPDAPAVRLPLLGPA